MRVKKQLALLITMLLFVSMVFSPQQQSAQAAQSGSAIGCSPNRGLDITFVLDNSGSMTGNDPENIRITEAMNLLKSFHEYDRASVIKFNETAMNLQSLTYDRYLVEQALKTGQPNGGTDMSTGMEEALKEFANNGGNNHKVMIILTDGYSINNERSLQLAQKANEANITIYTIGLGNDTDIDKETLTKIATNTNGQYERAVNASDLQDTFQNIRKSIEDLRGPKVFSDWTLTEDLHKTGDLVLTENMKLDLNGYDLKVDGDLVLLSCSELRAVSGTIQAGNVDQKAGATINLNNSQLDVKNEFTQDGLVRVNGDYGGDSKEEISIRGDYQQRIRGDLQLNGHKLLVANNLDQSGNIQLGGGSVHVNNNVTQKGFFDLEKGKMTISGNLTINGGSLVDDAFTENKSFNVNGGYLQVGSSESMAQTAAKGNVVQESGQLYVNYGIVDIFGDYTIKDGWLTMIHGTEDTTGPSNDMDRDGDYVHVYRDFTMESPRNHAERLYNYLGKPMHDQAHLTDGILQVDGDFRQKGDKQFHPTYSDRSQNYEQNYSRFNFVGDGRHKVLLTGKGTIEMQGTGSRFNILEVQGRIVDYTSVGQVKWNQLIENDKSANANLKSLTIQDIPVHNFNPAVLNYSDHAVPASTVTGPLRQLKVDAQAEDYRNAKVEIMGNTIGDDGTAQVKVLVTAHDGKTTKLYKVGVKVGGETGGKVTSIVLDRAEQTFMMNSSSSFTPSKATIGYTVYPKNATNQKVTWTSTNPAVATVSGSGIITPVGVGEATIIAETEDGGYEDSVHVEVTKPYDLLEGIDTLADLVSDSDRYNKIMALYDPTKIGIVVPGAHIQSVQFTTAGNLVSGRIKTSASASRVEVRVNNQQLPAPSVGTNEYLFNRAGLTYGDYIEVFVYNAAGDEIERVSTTYPVDYSPNGAIPYGYYSIQQLMNDPIFFNTLLNYYSLEELRFSVR
ncbi:VWA domain-containing protein [Bacillus sp. FJAT-42315]|uniref:VWA domain-containing protein n=1 Tax=Bacillus sp. FJAT-42315 TaxID=2014077 RepID=UPI000C23F76A|nr:VWA domain-containing protein [Bacillus sp. FJAT-42315]